MRPLKFGIDDACFTFLQISCLVPISIIRQCSYIGKWGIFAQYQFCRDVENKIQWWCTIINKKMFLLVIIYLLFFVHTECYENHAGLLVSAAVRMFLLFCLFFICLHVVFVITAYLWVDVSLFFLAIFVW